ncbi:MAG: tripartite tricarboxylate transporter substrate binding protein [Burkholderiales bacterium]|nr:tripartite tricarboxylate transporter substrate binding protein [Burkholderiales bacterium]
MRFWIAILFACVMTGAGGPAHAQAYPAKTVRIIATYPAGGLSDVMARLAAQILTDALGKPFIVENRPGASGVTGTDYVAKSPADGYTLLMGSFGPMTTAPALTANLGYAPAKDLTGVVIMSQVPNVFAVHPSVPAKTLPEFIALAKAAPKPMSAAISGIGGTTHLLTEMFKQKAGIDLLNVPYKGTAPALNDFVGGQVQVDFENLPTILPHIKSGRVRALAAASKARMAQLPELPTFAELGFPEVEISAWHGLLAPAGTPRDVIALINKTIVAALRLPATVERLRDMGVEVVAGTPEEMDAFLRVETVRWGKLIRDANIKGE